MSNVGPNTGRRAEVLRRESYDYIKAIETLAGLKKPAKPVILRHPSICRCNLCEWKTA